MSTYVISDIHGCNEVFRNALKSIGLKKKKDRLILLGDMIDRGPDSKGVLDTVFELKARGYQIDCLKGNHEKMLLDAFDDPYWKGSWLRNGGQACLHSFGVNKITKIPSHYIDFIASCPLYLELDSFILVHACLNMKAQYPFEDVNSLLWERKWKELYDAAWLGDRCVIHGHTPMRKREIKAQFDTDYRVYGIDNGCSLKRKPYSSLCVLRLEDMALHFEANHRDCKIQL